MKKFLILPLLFGICSVASAQYRGGGGGDKFYFGGGFGLSIGTDVTNISASPLVGYNITDQLSAGVSVTYQYIKFNGVDESFNSVGGSLFSRFLITEEIFAHAEFEHLKYDQVLVFPSGDFTSNRKSNNSLFLGGGYRQEAGRNASFFVLALYDVLWESAETSPYAIPLQVRAGFAVGF